MQSDTVERKQVFVLPFFIVFFQVFFLISSSYPFCNVSCRVSCSGLPQFSCNVSPFVHMHQDLYLQCNSHVAYEKQSSNQTHCLFEKIEFDKESNLRMNNYHYLNDKKRMIKAHCNPQFPHKLILISTHMDEFYFFEFAS